MSRAETFTALFSFKLHQLSSIFQHGMNRGSNQDGMVCPSSETTHVRRCLTILEALRSLGMPLAILVYWHSSPCHPPPSSEKTHRNISYQLARINFRTIFYFRRFWEFHQAVKCAVTSIGRSSPPLCSGSTYSWASSTESSWRLCRRSLQATSPSPTSGRRRAASCR